MSDLFRIIQRFFFLKIKLKILHCFVGLYKLEEIFFGDREVLNISTVNNKNDSIGNVAKHVPVGYGSRFT
jgi:hypothetical protein